MKVTAANSHARRLNNSRHADEYFELTTQAYAASAHFSRRTAAPIDVIYADRGH